MSSKDLPELAEFNLQSLYNSEMPASIPTLALQRMKALVENRPKQKFNTSSLEELQLRFLANAAVTANLIGKNACPDLFSSLDEVLAGESTHISDCVTHSCGLSHMELGRSLFLVMPSDKTCPAPEPVINALNGLVTDHASKRYWVLDMSACEQLKPSLVAYLLGFQHSLRDGSKLLLLWLRQDSVPEALLPAMTKSFRMRTSGAFLISEEVAPK